MLLWYDTALREIELFEARSEVRDLRALSLFLFRQPVPGGELTVEAGGYSPVNPWSRDLSFTSADQNSDEIHADRRGRDTEEGKLTS